MVLPCGWSRATSRWRLDSLSRPNLPGWQAVTSDRDFDPLAHIQRLRSRIVYDALGVRWTVQEVLGPTYSRRTSRSLVFAADGIMRRVRSFPENWVDLDDGALLRLSEGW